MFETDIGEDREHSGSFLYLSIPRFALREALLSIRARNWTRVNAVIQSSHRTLGGYKETIRVEVWYGYQLDGKHYAGHLVRDTCLYYWAVRKVMDTCSEGTNIPVLVNPLRPSESYLASGLGYVEPLMMGILGVGSLAILLGIPAALILDYIRR